MLRFGERGAPPFILSCRVDKFGTSRATRRCRVGVIDNQESSSSCPPSPPLLLLLLPNSPNTLCGAKQTRSLLDAITHRRIYGQLGRHQHDIPPVKINAHERASMARLRRPNWHCTALTHLATRFWKDWLFVRTHACFYHTYTAFWTFL